MRAAHLPGPTTQLPSTLGDLFFADANRVLAGEVSRTWACERSDDPGWIADVLGALAPEDVAVAGFSFEDDQPAVAHQIEHLRHIEGGMRGVAQQLVRHPDMATPRHHRVTEHPSPEAYGQAVAAALSSISEGHLEKVVLGRGLEVLSDPPLQAGEVLAQLAGGQDGTPAGRYLYALPVPGHENPLLIGASPELLVRRQGNLVEAMPLAGSLPRSVVADRRQATELLTSSAKDRAEHAHVVTDLVTRLREVCADVHAAPQQVIATDSMWHLATPIAATLASGSLDDPSCSALALARLVHPTPAVGGVPVDQARTRIAELETGPRSWFAGAVGWMNAAGDGEFALTLRSGLLSGSRLNVWAGAGIVAGSEPALEVRETGAKLSTMTKAVGL